MILAALPCSGTISGSGFKFSRYFQGLASALIDSHIDSSNHNRTARKFPFNINNLASYADSV